LELTEVDVLMTIMIVFVIVALIVLSTVLAVYAIMVEKENERLKKELEEKQRATQA